VVEDSNKSLIVKLSRSQIFKDYERAFTQTTGLPLSLRPVEVWQMAHQGKPLENALCMLMGQNSRSCAACLEAQRQISDPAKNEPQFTTCFAGLSEATVPVRVGNELVGFMQTGQVLLKKATPSEFKRTTKQLLDWGLKVNLVKYEEAYFQSRVLSNGQFEAMVRLLTIFAQHLSMVSNLALVQERNAEPPVIVKARQFIQDNHTNDLSLGEVARAVNTSTFYFCKMFRKSTGLNFTDYVSRVRIEKAKNLLINPNLRVSEIAYEVGFQSLTHFNRVFRKRVGQSPTDYRDHLPHL